MRNRQQSGSLDTWERAKERTCQLLDDYEVPRHDPAQMAELGGIVERLAKEAGLETLPEPG